ncbi:MAG: EAL domain-containing protein [Actinobacteria bacterium]|nr:EAL domain-containing protein [Actinomycetota bacterium]
MATVQTPGAPAAARTALDGEARLHALLGSIADALITVDGRGAIESANPAAEQLFGYPSAELLGRSFTALLAEPHNDEYSSYLRSFGAGERPAILNSPRELIGQRGDGSCFPLELTMTEAVLDVPVLVAVARDVTERRKAEDRLRRLADLDPLTGLYNRRRFEQELDGHIAYAARYGSGGSVLLLDLDNFKYANDSLGHRAGDELLGAVASLLKGWLRKTDVLARLGGDEFGMLLHGVDIAKTQAAAEELRALIGNNPFVIDRQSIRATVSVGIATVSREGMSANELIAQADHAKYKAKEAGRDRVSAFDPDSPITHEAIQVWSDRVREAVEKGRFVIHAQPILDLATDQVSQYELLISMRGEDGELVPPASFLDTAERFGLVQSLDRWVAQQAIRLIESHKRAGRDLVLEVNLSGKTLADPEFATGLGREMVRAGIESANLIFEVTETAAVADIEQARRFAESLTRMGCRFALDDFGSGFASFYYLKHLPIHVLKIDGEFVKDLPRSPNDQLIVSALVQVARGMGMKTVAEFVEDEETLTILKRLGVDYGQGYFIGRPAPVGELSG